MRALVTGGAGFIGSHLTRRLLSDGWSVTCLDNFSTGMRRNVAGLIEDRNFTLVECDVSSAPLSDDLAADRYFHMASPASPNPHTPRSYMALPLETAMVNSVGLQHVLDLARALRALGHSAHVLAPADPDRAEHAGPALPDFVTPAGRSLGIRYNGSVMPASRCAVPSITLVASIVRYVGTKASLTTTSLEPVPRSPTTFHESSTIS